MPCENGHLFAVDPKNSTSLFCPRCQGRHVEFQSVIQAKTEWLLEDHFTDEKILNIIKDYDKTHLILYLLTRLNHISNLFLHDKKAGIPIDDFGYTAYILKQIYPASGFGNKQLQDPRHLDEEIEVLQGAYTEIISAFRDARNQFAICVKRDDFSGKFEDFVSDYELLQSEYGLCFERCMKSIVCGDWEDYEEYSYVSDVLRSVDKTDVDDVSSSREFADAWYQHILQLRLIASSDDMVGDTYYTQLPDNITVFEIEEFLDKIDSQFSQKLHTKMKEESWICTLDPKKVNRIGRQVFGSSWSEAKDTLIITEDNLDAHPFLFALEVPEERRLPGSRKSREIMTTKIFYPRFFARIMKFQVFPLLQNGNEPRSHQLLADITGNRGTVYERNLHNFLTDQGIECYHSAEITKANPNEIDLLCVFEDSLKFIEVKYLMPPIRINDTRGIRELNEDFDRLIFNEVVEDSNRKAKGKPYQEKVNAWVELNPGDLFTSQVGKKEGDRQEQMFKQEWSDLDVEMYVVSNVVPSYIEKNEVRFLTDLELYKWIKNGDNSVFYSSS